MEFFEFIAAPVRAFYDMIFGFFAALPPVVVAVALGVLLGTLICAVIFPKHPPVGNPYE